MKVNGESISDSGDFTHAMHGRKNNTVTVSIIREKKEQNLTLTVPDRNQSELLEWKKLSRFRKPTPKQ